MSGAINSLPTGVQLRSLNRQNLWRHCMQRKGRMSNNFITFSIGVASCEYVTFPLPQTGHLGSFDTFASQPCFALLVPWAVKGIDPAINKVNRYQNRGGCILTHRREKCGTSGTRAQLI